jgi:hypothetical protein
MTVRCTKCGEELLGAVNCCWKCGQAFALRPEIDGRPPVRPAGPPTAEPALEAEVIEDATVDQLAAATPVAVAAQVQPMPMTAVPAHPPVAARVIAPPKVSTADFINAQRASLTAMGGTAAAFVLGVFALGIGLFGFWGAPIALLGLVMGIWGLYSPRRGWALAAMLVCCLAIGLSSYTGARQLYRHMLKSRVPAQEEDSSQFSPP